MNLLCISVSYHNAPVELRESLSLSSEAIEEAIANHPLRIGIHESLTEIAILSTCNRLEIYALVMPPEGADDSLQLAWQSVLAYLRDAYTIPVDQMEPYFHFYSGIQVAEHLFQVAAGMDSIALGEAQILGQVSRTLDTALRLGSVRHVLSTLFRSAIHAGKRVQSETEIGRHPTSISSIAVQLAEARLGTLSGQKVLVIGVGKMGRHAITALKECGARKITLTNRTYQHASDLVKASNGTMAILSIEDLADGLADADLVFTSTSALAPIIYPDMAAEIMAQRPERPLTIIDLAVPRNVDPKVKAIPNIHLLDMDDLQSFVNNAELSSHKNIASARMILDEETAAYEKLLRVIPFIGEMHRKVEKIRQMEVDRALRNLHDPEPQVREQIELLSRSLVRKILHEPTMHLRAESDQETLNDYVDTLTKLFDLNENVESVALYKEGTR
jgi:glutamyl-tRNA reductase